MRAALFSLVLICPAAAADQSVAVAVSDPSQAAVVGAQVTMQCPGGTEQTARTGDTGAATFAVVTGDGCVVKVFQPGSASGAGTVAALLEVAMNVNTTEVKPKSVGRKFKDWITSCTRK